MRVPPPGIEPGLQVPETCVISFSPRGRGSRESMALPQAMQTVNAMSDAPSWLGPDSPHLPVGLFLRV